MHTLYLISVSVHILAAAFWMGGILFFVFMLLPFFKRLKDHKAAAPLFASETLKEAGIRWRNSGWICFFVFFATGFFQLYMRGVYWDNLIQTNFWLSPFGKTLAWKLSFALTLVALSAVHDFWVGPKALEKVIAAPSEASTHKWRRAARKLGRLNALLSLGALVAGVVLVRGP